MSLLIFLAGMLILGGIALGAYLVPSFRDLLEQILVVAGAAAAIVGYAFIMFTEEEPLIRSLMRYFPPALVFSVLKRPHETWPYFVLLIAGLASLAAGLTMQKG